MPKIEFLLQNQTAASTNRRVLVFLRPARLAEDPLLFHAWQTLSPPPRGGRQGFTLEGRLAIMAGEDRPQGSRSARWPIEPGQTLVARSRNGQGPELNPGPEEEQLGGPARLLNRGRESLRVTWYCDGRPVLRQTVAPGSSAELELAPGDLLFQILEPSRDGLYRPADVLRNPIEYRVPADARLVNVTWYRTADSDELSFDPLSTAPSEPESLPQQEPTARER